MTYKIITNGITILLIETPEDGKDFYINNVGCIRYSVGRWSKCIEPEEIGIYLNKDEYEILGKSTELSEEQMKEICASDRHDDMFIDFREGSTRYAYLLKSVQESYLSLLEANGIVDRNPIERTNCNCNGKCSGEQQLTCLSKNMGYLEAQSKVKHYLVLKKDMKKEENKHTITINTEWVDMDKLVLTNQRGDTYTTKSEELIDFILSSESENERLKAESRLIINEILKVVDDGIQTSAIIAIANKFNIKL